MTTELTREEWIERRALYLQSKGPDEFPFGYFKYLAEKELEEEDDRP